MAGSTGEEATSRPPDCNCFSPLRAVQDANVLLARGVASFIGGTGQLLAGWSASKLRQALTSNDVDTVILSGTLHFSTEDWQRVLEALQVNTSCLDFRAECCGLGDGEAKLIAEALKAQGSGLEELVLAYNPGITEVGGVLLAKAIGHSKRLRVLQLEGTNVGDTTARELAQQLPNHKSLETLQLFNTLVSAWGAEQIERAARNNDSLKRVHVFGGVDALAKEHFGWRIWPKSRDVDAAVELHPTTLASSHFGRHYDKDKEPCASCAELHTLVKDIISLHMRCNEFLADPLSQQQFGEHLIQQAVNKKGLVRPEQHAAVLWTSDKEMVDTEGTRHRFYSMVQKALRDDRHDELLMKTAKYSRTLNQLVVSRRGSSGSAGSDRATGLPEKTWRGAWIPRVEAEQFFQQGEKYRYAGYLASSTTPGTDEEFLRLARPTCCQDPVPVKFVFHFDRVKGCKHVNLLEGVTLVPGEQEWLFQHYSTFSVQSAPPTPIDLDAYSPQKPAEIHLDVIPDNMTEPPDVKLAAWH